MHQIFKTCGTQCYIHYLPFLLTVVIRRFDVREAETWKLPPVLSLKLQLEYQASLVGALFKRVSIFVCYKFKVFFTVLQDLGYTDTIKYYKRFTPSQELKSFANSRNTRVITEFLNRCKRGIFPPLLVKFCSTESFYVEAAAEFDADVIVAEYTGLVYHVCQMLSLSVFFLFFV